jgi:copper chaperone CopZ
MTCEGCAGKLRKALLQLDGISDVEIDTESGKVVVYGSSSDTAAIAEAVYASGFSL